jgi:arylsulfatase A-like enzyme
MPHELLRISVVLICLFAVFMSAQAETIEYTFEDATKITGAMSDIVYSAPDVNSFGEGIVVSDLELSDNTTSVTDYGRIEDIGGGSVEAAVNDRNENTISFIMTIDETVIVDLTHIVFDTSFYFYNTGTSSVGWDFQTVVSGGVSNVTSSAGWTHDGATNYQSPGGAASGDIALAGLTGLTDTTVTFVWTLDSSRNNTFARAAMGLDDVVLTGVVVERLPRLIYGFASDTDALVSAGGTVTLSWEIADEVTALSIDPDIGDVLPLTTDGVGQITVSVDAGTVFTLRASNGDYSLSSEVIITETQPEIHSFTVDDLYVQPNDPVVLSWETSGADTVAITEMGVVSLDGNATVYPSETTTYTLLASNAFESVEREVTVTVGPARPNILLMLVDDWGVTDLSVPFAYTSYDDSGTALITNLNLLHQTPNLETLASMGMKFTQAYATPKCSSTRATLMTGYHPARHGITFHLAAASTIGNGPNNWRFNGLDATDVTIAHMLAPAHYRTIHCGKWHLGGPGDYAQYPTAVGFDINIGGSNAGSPARYVANAAGFASNSKPMPNLDHYQGTGMYLTKALTIELNQAMSDAVDDGVPFFGYMSYYGVHDPETTNPDAVGDYSAALDADHRKFCTMVEAIDVSIATVIEHLEALGIAEETLIIHLGDNGSENPVHGNQASIPRSPYDDFPMRGQKNDGYQGGCRVPLIISWAKPNPDHPMQQSLSIAGGSVEHDIVGIEDIVPTILAIAGVEPRFTDGYDLSPYLRGETGSHRPQRYLLHYPNGSFPNGQLSWYREGDWKLMYGYEADQFLLFNLADDPTESNDLAASEPARVVTMARAMVRELDSKWGLLGKLWPVLAGTYQPRPGTDDPFFLPYEVDGRDAVDSDGDGLTDVLEDADGDGLVSAGETDSDDSDTDGDQTDDYSEFRLNLDPLDANSFFAVQSIPTSEESLLLKWPSVPNLLFNVRASEDLSIPISDWEVVESNVAAHETLNETMHSLSIDSDRKFFSVELLP